MRRGTALWLLFGVLLWWAWLTVAIFGARWPR